MTVLLGTLNRVLGRPSVYAVARTLLSFADVVANRRSPCVQRSGGMTTQISSFPLLGYVYDPQRSAPLFDIPVIVAPIKLEDSKNGYLCTQTHMNGTTTDKIERARSLVAKALGDYGYEGWSNDIDRGYDRDSWVFVVEKNGEIVATCRMTMRISHNRIPFENGIRPNGGSYELRNLDKKIADINSFYYAKGHSRALFLLFATMARFGALVGVQKAFCMLDPENPKIKAIYLKAGFRFSEEFKEPIFFPTFGKTVNGYFEPTRWTIMEMDVPYILLHAFNAELRYSMV